MGLSDSSRRPSSTPGAGRLPPVLHLQVPLLPPSSLRVAPGAASEEEEGRALERGSSGLQSWGLQGCRPRENFQIRSENPSEGTWCREQDVTIEAAVSHTLVSFHNTRFY